MKVSSLVLGVGLSCSALVHAQPIEAPRMFVQDNYEFFKASPGRDCASAWIDASFCRSTQPKAWTADEMKKLRGYFGAFFKADLTRFFSQIRNKGYDTLYRYGHGFQWSDGRFDRDEHSAWVWEHDYSINISDLAFARSIPDPVSGYDVGELTLFHELIHAFTDFEGTLVREFGTLAGWEERNGEWALRGVDMNEVRNVLKESRDLIGAGKIREGTLLDRNFGMRHGFPTAYAMTSPDECIAEVAAHVQLDPRAKDYLKREWIDWIKTHVLN